MSGVPRISELVTVCQIRHELNWNRIELLREEKITWSSRFSLGASEQGYLALCMRLHDLDSHFDRN